MRIVLLLLVGNNLLIFITQPNHREGRTTSSKQLNNARVQYNGGLLPDIILLTLCDYIGEAFRYHEEFLPLEPMLFRQVET